MVVEAVLADVEPEFEAMYAATGRHSVPPEHLLKASVLMALYSIRRERQFCERLRYDLLFKYFLDLNVDDERFDHSTFSKNRERLLKHEVADRFFAAVVRQAKLRRYVSGEHFSVDGTLLEAWASHESFRPKDESRGGRGHTGRPGSERRGQLPRPAAEQRDPPIHPDREALLARKSDGVAAKLSYAGHLPMEHRSALIVDLELTPATGRAERETALRLLRRLPPNGASSNRGRRQGLRHPGVRRRLPGAEGHAPRRPQHQQPSERERRADHTPSRAPGQPAHPQADRGALRLAKDRRWRAQGSATSGSAATEPGSWWLRASTT